MYQILSKNIVSGGLPERHIEDYEYNLRRAEKIQNNT